MIGILAAMLALYAVSQSSGQRDQTSLAPRDEPTIVFVLAPVVRPGPPEFRFPKGSRIIRLTHESAHPSTATLTDGFFAAADPHIAGDGETIIFAGQKDRSEPWQIWSIPADGTEPRQITHCSRDCLKPVVLSGGQLAYTRVTRNFGHRTTAVWVCDGQGNNAQRITLGPGDFEAEAALRSGRLLVSARWPLTSENAAEKNRTLYTIRPDGSGLTALRDTLDRTGILADATELSDRSIIFVQSIGEGPGNAGERLAILRPGAIHASPLMSATAAYQSVAEMPGDGLLLSRASSPHGEFNLYKAAIHSNGHGSLVYARPHFSSVDAIALVPHPAPQRYWSILHPGVQTGRVLCLNAYLSQDVPGGRIKGKLTAVRVLALDRSSGQPFSLGQAPVESDGSFYASVPADMPIRFELLGTHGEILRSQHGWIWVRNGEDRGCLGCHESHALAPENRSPLALQRLDTPVLLQGRTPSHLLRTRPGTR